LGQILERRPVTFVISVTALVTSLAWPSALLPSLAHKLTGREPTAADRLGLGLILAAAGMLPVLQSHRPGGYMAKRALVAAVLSGIAVMTVRPSGLDAHVSEWCLLGACVVGFALALRLVPRRDSILPRALELLLGLLWGLYVKHLALDPRMPPSVSALYVVMVMAQGLALSATWRHRRSASVLLAASAAATVTAALAQSVAILHIVLDPSTRREYLLRYSGVLGLVSGGGNLAIAGVASWVVPRPGIGSTSAIMAFIGVAAAADALIATAWVREAAVVLATAVLLLVRAGE
jgi:hypothetical protein